MENQIIAYPKYAPQAAPAKAPEDIRLAVPERLAKTLRPQDFEDLNVGLRGNRKQRRVAESKCRRLGIRIVQ